jgi:general secretion pathway protein K
MDTFRAMERRYRPKSDSAFLQAIVQVGSTEAPHGSKGVALVMVLWVVALLSVVVMEFAFAMRTETTIAKNYSDSICAYYVARGGIQYGLVETIRWLNARQDQTLPALITRRTIKRGPEGLKTQEDEKKEEPLWRPDGRPYEVTIPGGKCRIRIQDESGKIGINWAPDHLLRHMVGSMGLDNETRDTVVDSILDWIDDDQLHRLNGAEEPYYQSLPKPYSCKDGPIDILEELLLVRGVTREIFYGGRIGTTMPVGIGPIKPVKGPGLVDLFTVYLSSNRVNINTATKAVLEAIPGIGPKMAMSIITAREKKEFNSLQEVWSTLGQELRATEEFLSVSSSNFFTIYAQGEVETGVRRAVRAVVSVSGGSKPSYRIVQWDDDAEII